MVKTSFLHYDSSFFLLWFLSQDNFHQNICLLQVGNAVTDDYHDWLGYNQFLWSSGLISDQTYKLLNLKCLNESLIKPSESCLKILDIGYAEIGDIDVYSIFTPVCPSDTSQLNLVKRKHVSVPLLHCVFWFIWPFLWNLQILFHESRVMYFKLQLCIVRFKDKQVCKYSFVTQPEYHGLMKWKLFYHLTCPPHVSYYKIFNHLKTSLTTKATDKIEAINIFQLNFDFNKSSYFVKI